MQTALKICFIPFNHYDLHFLFKDELIHFLFNHRRFRKGLNTRTKMKLTLICSVEIVKK